ncbi:MAG: zf-HC2 domain-containing protein [Acidobacteria bacterium]|nr:zf-HC2 domain-containing protein [Acidobacteriota bacterium]
MVFDRNNSALEFESTLRRHLKKSKGSVETSSSGCFGFDADLTSSYLEGAVTGALKSSFEVHLAGCPDCRRHLIQLSRLTQQSGPETVQVPAGKRTDDWLSVLRDRFTWIGSQLLDPSLMAMELETGRNSARSVCCYHDCCGDKTLAANGFVLCLKYEFKRLGRTVIGRYNRDCSSFAGIAPGSG